MLLSLPNEIILHLVPFLDPTAYLHLKCCNKPLQSLLTSPSCQIHFLMGLYGRRFVIYYLTKRHLSFFINHSHYFDLFLSHGALIPRFFAQTCYQASLTESNPESIPKNEIMEKVKALSKSLYTEKELLGNDVQEFEYLSNDLKLNLKNAKVLFYEHHFVPLPELTPSAVFRLYKLSQIDLTLFDFLLTRIYILDINDSLMRMVLANFSTKNAYLLKHLIRKGFKLTPDILICQFRNTTSPELFETLFEIMPKKSLKPYAIDVLTKLFGPHGHFSATLVDTLIEKFEIKEANLQLMIIYHYKFSSSSTPSTFQTRCFEQPNAFDCWAWILRKFGADHEIAESSFDDMLLWLSQANGQEEVRYMSKEQISLILNNYLNQNFNLLQPRHFEYLSKMASVPYWGVIASNLLSQLYKKIYENYYKQDYDVLWLWSITIKNYIRNRKPEKRRNSLPNIKPNQLQEFQMVAKSTLGYCEKILSNLEYHQLNIPRSKTVDPVPYEPIITLRRIESDNVVFVKQKPSLLSFFNFSKDKPIGDVDVNPLVLERANTLDDLKPKEPRKFRVKLKWLRKFVLSCQTTKN
ncbi:hypothetical protein BC833DRAFT_601665 [Globomyces pollinis-pini]|nr:hypothetical protein BC833DRAFT_601665 [Globomyces pollinis-pini]